MRAINTTYFNPNPLNKDVRTILIALGISLAAAAGLLTLQSFKYASSIPVLWQTGQQVWGEALGAMLKGLAVWAVVLGVVFSIRYVTQPVVKYGGEFWRAVVTGFPLGLLLPYLLVLGAGILIFILLGLLSLLIAEVLPYAALQFAWLATAYLVFIWIAVGMPPLLAGVFKLPRWYYKFIVVLLFLQLALDILQNLVSAMGLLAKNSIWQADEAAFYLAILGSLLVTLVAVVWSLRGQPSLTIVYAITGIYLASVVTGNFSERLFGWGDLPSAILALLAPLVYLQAAKWILRRDGTAFPGLASGFAGLLTGLFFLQLLHLRISGQGWISLLYGIVVVLGFGLLLGMLLGRRITKLFARQFQLRADIVRYMDIGLVAGIMAGMFISGFLAR